MRWHCNCMVRAVSGLSVWNWCASQLRASSSCLLRAIPALVLRHSLINYIPRHTLAPPTLGLSITRLFHSCLVTHVWSVRTPPLGGMPIARRPPPVTRSHPLCARPTRHADMSVPLPPLFRVAPVPGAPLPFDPIWHSLPCRSFPFSCGVMLLASPRHHILIRIPPANRIIVARPPSILPLPSSCHRRRAARLCTSSVPYCAPIRFNLFSD